MPRDLRHTCSLKLSPLCRMALRQLGLAALAACIVASANGQAIRATAVAPPDDGSAQADAPLPINVVAEPALVVVRVKGANRSGVYVRFQGNTLPFGGKPVHYKVEGFPVPMSGSLPVDEAGRFTSRGFAPLEGGDYKLTVTAPDGRGKAIVTVRAFELEDIEDELVDALDKAGQAAEKALALIEPKIDALPHSPVKEPARRKTAAARAALRELIASPGAGGSLRGLIGAIGSSKAGSEAAVGAVQGLAQGIANLNGHTARVRDLTARMSSADTGCHQMVFVAEYFKLVSALLNVQRDVMKVAVGLAKDIVSDAASNTAKNRGASSGRAFGAGQVVKNAPELLSGTSRFYKLADNAAGILADLGAFIADTGFSAYCEQFVGPIDATMTARFDDPALWWTYDYKISGRLVLYYPKSAKGESIRLNGRLEGMAHSFKTKDNALAVLYPGLMSSAIQVRKDFPPIEAGATVATMATQGFGANSGYLEGSIAGAAAPNSFAISVTGLLEKDSISVLLGAALSDFQAAHRVVAVVASPLALLQGLTPISYALPFKNAHHVFLRASQGQALRLELKTTGSKMTAQGQFKARRSVPGAQGEYSLGIKVCNPDCDSAPAPAPAPNKKM